MSSRIQLRRGTAAAWIAANPVLLAGEPGYETDTGQEKRGDGSTAWTSLAYTPVGILFADSFGLVPNKGTDQTTALNAAFASGGIVLFRPGIYLGNNLTLGAQTVLMALGAGGAASDGTVHVLIEKNANGPLITLSGGSQKMIDISLEGVGGTFTGDNLAIPPGSSLAFEWRNGSNLNAAGYAANFNGATSSGLERFYGGVWHNQGLTLPAFRLPDAEVASSDKTLFSIFCSGGDLADFNGCQTVLVSGCDMRNVTFGAASHKVTMTGNRMATVAADTTVLGLNHTIVGNTHAGRFVIDSTCSNSHVGPNVTTAQSVNNSSTCTLITSYNGNLLPEYSKANGYPGYLTPQEPFSGSEAGVVGTANQGYFNRLQVSEPTLVNSIAFVVTNAATNNDNIDLGIYNAAGTTRLTANGSTAGLVNSTGIKNVTLTTPITLLPGVTYWVAIAYGTVGGTAATIWGVSLGTSSLAAIFGAGTTGNYPFMQIATSFPLPASVTLAPPAGSTQPLLAART